MISKILAACMLAAVQSIAIDVTDCGCDSTTIEGNNFAQIDAADCSSCDGIRAEKSSDDGQNLAQVSIADESEVDYLTCAEVEDMIEANDGMNLHSNGQSLVQVQ